MSFVQIPTGLVKRLLIRPYSCQTVALCSHVTRELTNHVAVAPYWVDVEFAFAIGQKKSNACPYTRAIDRLSPERQQLTRALANHNAACHLRQ